MQNSPSFTDQLNNWRKQKESESDQYVKEEKKKSDEIIAKITDPFVLQIISKMTDVNIDLKLTFHPQEGSEKAYYEAYPLVRWNIGTEIGDSSYFISAQKAESPEEAITLLFNSLASAKNLNGIEPTPEQIEKMHELYKKTIGITSETGFKKILGFIPCTYDLCITRKQLKSTTVKWCETTESFMLKVLADDIESRVNKN